MDIIKKILCFTLMGDLFYFDKKVKTTEEVEGLNKIYRFNGNLKFVLLCILVIAYAVLLCLMFIPIINLIAFGLFFVLFYGMFFFIGIYSIVRNIIVLVSYKKINLENFNEDERKYLRLNKLNSILFCILLIVMLVMYIFLIFTTILAFIVEAVAFVLGILTLVLALTALGLLIAKVVVYVNSRFKLYKVIKTEEF